MKKMLSMLGAIGLVATTGGIASTVVSCGSDKIEYLNITLALVDGKVTAAAIEEKAGVSVDEKTIEIDILKDEDSMKVYEKAVKDKDDKKFIELGEAGSILGMLDEDGIPTTGTYYFVIASSVKGDGTDMKLEAAGTLIVTDETSK